MKPYMTKAVAFAALMAVIGCKKDDDRELIEQQTSTVVTGTTTIDTVAETESSAGETTGNETVRRKYFKSKKDSRKLTQYQIDSIKTERGALITPAENVGPSLTPGSGKAVPTNTKVTRGTSATMGSSAGN